MKIPFMKQISWYLVIAMFVIAVAPRADAAFVPSEAIAMFDRAVDMEKIQKALETKMVSERFKQLGLTQDEINNR
ncbi:MAG: hypothetical protein L0Y62_06695, partial [Nitrospirae bacterium]|nr:hypothetical protein [Nitrospirota bacterium]